MAPRSLTASEASEVFNEVVANYRLKVRSRPGDFSFGKKCIILGANSRGEHLANGLFDQLFPRSSSGKYYHYTSYGGFKGIVSSGRFRLYNLHKRFGSGEFRTFCRDHNFDGYLRLKDDGIEDGHYADLMDDLFYTSLTAEKGKDAELLWERFANHGEGVRLSLQIDTAPNYPNFRAVAYQEPDCLPVLKELRATFTEWGYRFVNLGLSRMGGFYQRRDYSSQSEQRLLAKRFPEAPEQFPFQVQTEGKGRIKFIEAILGNKSHPWFNIKLLEVLPGKSCSADKVQRYLDARSIVGNVKLAQQPKGSER